MGDFAKYLRSCALALTALVLLAACSARAASPEADFIFDAGVITGYTGAGGAVEIPATIGGADVTSIGISAFQGCTTLTGMIIPVGVTRLEAKAFT
ncbi:MAG: hypothetical protein WAX69_16685, partial [Victivallales bacterium]